MKKLKAVNLHKCTGCELCVMEAQRQMKKITLQDALIRVFKNKKEDSEYLQYSVELDPQVNTLEIEKIREICPTRVLEIVEERDEL